MCCCRRHCHCCCCCTSAVEQATARTVDAAIANCVHWATTIKTNFIDADGAFFPMKLLLLEVVELIVQLTSLLSSAGSSDAELVVISSLLLSLNLIVLPCATFLARCVFRSPFVVVATVLTVEIFFDKMFTGVAVLLRYETLIESNLTVFEQLMRHGGCLIPAILTALGQLSARVVVV